MNRTFTPDNPPKSGASKRLWDWYATQTGNLPRMLNVIRPGRHQLANGAARYAIVDHLSGFDYLVYDVAETLKHRLDEADRDRRTGNRHLW